MENSLDGYSFFQVKNFHTATNAQRNFLSPLSEQPKFLQPMALVNVKTEWPSPVQSDQVIPDCCSPSRWSDRQICMSESKVSESGWTIYLDQSTDLNSHHSSGSIECSPSGTGKHSLITKPLKKRSAQRKQFVDKKIESNFEDSSMVSDASSGPEQPYLYEDTEERSGQSAVERKALDVHQLQGCRSDDLGDDACTSKISCESIPTRSCIMNKRKRTGIEEESFCTARVADLNREETTQAEEIKMDIHSSEGSGDNYLDSTTSKGVFPLCEDQFVDSKEKNGLIDDRLHMLRRLIPNSEKLEGEEMLAITIEYVKSLELKIKMFETVKMEIADNTNMFGIETFFQRRTLAVKGLQRVIGALNIQNGMEESALQEKGLCLVPVSLLGDAL